MNRKAQIGDAIAALFAILIVVILLLGMVALFQIVMAYVFNVDMKVNILDHKTDEQVFYESQLFACYDGCMYMVSEMTDQNITKFKASGIERCTDSCFDEYYSDYKTREKEKRKTIIDEIIEARETE